MERWKCPDCDGWVVYTVLVHFCAPLKTSTGTNVVPVMSPPNYYPPNYPSYPFTYSVVPPDSSPNLRATQ